MRTNLITDDEKGLLGISLVAEGEDDTKALEKFWKEGMLPVSYDAAEGLTIAFGHPIVAAAESDEDVDVNPTEGSRWAG